MKQFIVDRHTTPNTPTLEQVPTEKIPIYENRAAVTADLANLTVGQIVATKDTGDELSHPVNVVEEGNLHAVSSDAVAESLSYSTEEKFTGSYWIDGKPIYRKVLYPTTVALQHANWGWCGFPNTIMSDVKYCVKASALTLYHDKLQYFISDILIIPEVGFFSITADLYIGSAIILEYTKTTDYTD